MSYIAYEEDQMICGAGSNREGAIADARQQGADTALLNTLPATDALIEAYQQTGPDEPCWLLGQVDGREVACLEKEDVTPPYPWRHFLSCGKGKFSPLVHHEMQSPRRPIVLTQADILDEIETHLRKVPASDCHIEMNRDLTTFSWQKTLDAWA